MNFQN